MSSTLMSPFFVEKTYFFPSKTYFLTKNELINVGLMSIKYFNKKKQPLVKKLEIEETKTT